MTAPGVLAALRLIESKCFAVGLKATAEETREARATVKEVLDAAAAVERYATRHDGDERMFARLHTALARADADA